MGTISLPEALRLRTWDAVTLQRSSGMSGEYDSYQPYLNELAAAVRTACPGARLFIHQTWAYEDGADHPDLARYGRDRKRMFAQLTAASAAVMSGRGAVSGGSSMAIANE